MAMLVRRNHGHGYTRLPAGAPLRDLPPGPPDEQYAGFSVEIGLPTLDIQVATDPATSLPTVVNGHRLVLSNKTPSGYSRIKPATWNGITKFVARTGANREYLGTFDCRTMAALMRARHLGLTVAAAPVAAIGDIEDTSLEDEWDEWDEWEQQGQDPAGTGPARLSAAGTRLHLSQSSASGYTGVCASKAKRRASNPSASQRYRARYRGKPLGEFPTAIGAAEAYALAYAADTSQGRCKVLLHGRGAFGRQALLHGRGAVPPRRSQQPSRLVRPPTRTCP